MPSEIPNIVNRYNQEHNNIDTQAERERRKVEQTTREAQARLDEQETQARLQSEQAIQREQRKQDLPSTKPRQEYISSVKQSYEIYKGKVSQAKNETETSRKNALSDLEKQAKEAHDKIEKAKQEAIKAREEFEASNIELDTGEYISKADFSKLSSEQQEQLKLLGVEKFNLAQQKEATEQTELQTEFEANNIKLDTGEYVSKTDFEALSSEEQAQLKSVGVEKFNESQQQEVIAESELSGEEIFGQMQASGEIPAEATYISYNKETGEVQYQTPQPELSDEDVIKSLKDSGDIPENAINIVYDKDTHEIKYQVPGAESAIVTQPVTQPIVSMDEWMENYFKEHGWNYKEPKNPFDSVANKTYGQRLNEAQREYRKQYGVMAVVRSDLAKVGEFFFAPARVLAPEIEKPVTLTEWVIGSGQLALLFAPIIGKAVGGIGGKLASKSLQAGASGIFVEETVRNWKEMTPTSKVINIAVNAAIVLPMLSTTLRKVANITAKAVSPVEIASEELIRSEALLIKKMSEPIEKIAGKAAAANFVNLGKAEIRYIDKLTLIERIKTLDTSSLVGRAKTVSQLTISDVARLAKTTGLKSSDIGAIIRNRKLKNIAESAESVKISALSKAVKESEELARELENAGRKYVTSVKPKIGFDDPAVSKIFDDLPKEIVKNAQGAVDNLRPTKNILKQLQDDVTNTGTKLKVAQEKWPTQPAKWSDLAYNHAIAQGKLEQAAKNNVINIYNDLLEAKKRLAEAKEFISHAKGEVLTELKSSGASKQAKVTKLEKELRTALSAMEPEYGGLSRGGGKGGIATLVKRPPTGRITGGTRVESKISPKETTRAISASVVRPAFGLSGSISPDIEKIVSDAVREATDTATKTITSPNVTSEVVTNIKQITEQAIQEAVHLNTSGYTQPEIASSIEAKIQNMIDPITSPVIKSRLRLEAKNITRLSVKTALKITDINRIKIPPVIPIIIPDGKGGKRELTPEEKAGSVAWKQGFNYILWYPPYRQNNIVNSHKPFPGVRIVNGLDSAYKTIVRLGGKIPKRISRRMGFQQITVTTISGKPKLHFEKKFVKHRVKDYPKLHNKSITLG